MRDIVIFHLKLGYVIFSWLWDYVMLDWSEDDRYINCGKFNNRAAEKSQSAQRELADLTVAGSILTERSLQKEGMRG